MHNNSTEHGDLDRAVLLRNCNAKLTQWMGVWETEMQRANGERFHMEFLKFFRLYVRLFLNSFGIQGSMASMSNVRLSARFSLCNSVTDAFAANPRRSECASALDVLHFCHREPPDRVSGICEDEHAGASGAPPASPVNITVDPRY